MVSAESDLGGSRRLIKPASFQLLPASCEIATPKDLKPLLARSAMYLLQASFASLLDSRSRITFKQPSGHRQHADPVAVAEQNGTFVSRL